MARLRVLVFLLLVAGVSDRVFSCESRVGVDPNPFPQFEAYQFGDRTVPFQEVVPDTLTTVTDGAGHTQRRHCRPIQRS